MTERETVEAAARRLLRMLDDRTRRRTAIVVKLPIAMTMEHTALDLSSAREIKQEA